MENIKIWIDGVQKEVFGLFYIFNSKYYFIYTEKETDENGYVILYMTTIGKETKNTENGAIETGAMIGMEIANPEEQQQVQTSISYIVEDKKNNTKNPQIQYLPMNMLSELKIISKKRFRLLKSIMEENFKLIFDSTPSNENNLVTMQPVVPIEPLVTDQIVQPLAQVTQAPVVPEPKVQEVVQPLVTVEPLATSQIVQPLAQVIPAPVEQLPSVSEPQQVVQPETVVQSQPTNNAEENVIIDYRSKYFEEQEKNKELQEQINNLTQKLEEIKKVIN